MGRQQGIQVLDTSQVASYNDVSGRLLIQNLSVMTLHVNILVAPAFQIDVRFQTVYQRNALSEIDCKNERTIVIVKEKLAANFSGVQDAFTNWCCAVKGSMVSP